MALYSTLRGLMNSLFQLGGPSGVQLKNNGGALDIRNSTDLAYVNMNVAKATADDHAATYKNVIDRAPLIQFDFNGSTPPTPGFIATRYKYGLCHTGGGIYNAGQIYYDDTTSLVLIPIYIGMALFTTTAITGTVSFIANGCYAAENTASPFSWTMKGDLVTNYTGLIQYIRLNIGTSVTYTSTTSIPNNSKIMKVFVNITAGYSVGTTLAITVNGSAPLNIMLDSENDPTTISAYKVEPLLDVSPTNAGAVRATIAGIPAVGSGEVLVGYITAFNS